MSLSDFLEKLQNKPRPVRVFILWTSVAVCMTVLLVFWVGSLEPNQGQTQINDQAKSREFESLTSIKKEIPTLWQGLKAGIGNLFKSEPDYSQDRQTQPDIKIESDNQPDQQNQVPPAELP